LFRGTYDVVPAPAADLLPVPAGQTVILDAANVSGRADFKMQSFGGLDVSARTPWDTPVAGVVAVLTKADGTEVARGTTSAEGKVSLARVAPGTYTLKLTMPAGFTLTGDASRSLTLTPGTQTLALRVTPLIQSLITIPDNLSVEVGSALDVQLVARDINGNIIPQVQAGGWTGLSGHIAAGGMGLRGQIGGKYPSAAGGAQFGVELNGRLYTLSATVTSHIQGTVTKQTAAGPVPGSGTLIVVEKGGVKVGETGTQGNGSYSLTGLVAGTYVVKAVAPQGMTVSPASSSVTLGSASPTGTANFTVSQLSTGGADRPNVLVCGSSSRNVASFFPAGSTLTLVTNTCSPDANTQALLLTRSWYSGISAGALQTYLNAGGIVITEYNISHTIWGMAFGTGVSQGTRYGYCKDVIPSVSKFSPSDPFWLNNVFQQMDNSDTGCGYSIGHFPGITPLLGWNSSAVAVGYRDLGAGRLWATDFDWQDRENYPYQDYTAKLLGYMLSHRR
ncbi:MAG: SpaA isopeptide-forming pilin-related protein, partial [Longimicrobiales bacterium]|nr:SpaA isopeptide-forming pilin-related protein [Longimicrobiales bacterium]